MQFKALGIAVAASLLVLGCGGDSVEGTKSAMRLGAPVISSGTATFTGNRSNYTIAKSGASYLVTDITGSDGTSTLTNVQSLKFADFTVNLGVGEKSQTISAANLNSLIELYIAFFNRVPDADGLSYWIDQFKAGSTLVQISESFYNAAVQYSSLTGYSSTMSNAEFVRVIYQNVLGRSGANAPPDADVNYWAGELGNGNATKGGLIATMLNSAHSFQNDATWGWVPQLLDNKLTVANYFAVQQGLNYNTADASITNTMAIAAAVTAANTANAISMVGVADTGFSLVPVVPGAPTVGTATPANAGAIVAFTAPASDGGAGISSYTVTCSGGSASFAAIGSSSPITVTGLANGTAYACSVTATNSAGTGAASSSASVTPSGTSSGTFSVSSSVAADGGTLPADYTCDGAGSTIPLSWSNAPSGTAEFAVLMTTLPGDGTTKWNWVLYGIPGTTTSLTKDTFAVGMLGVTSDGPNNIYAPPCAQGPGAKVYTVTVYALSAAPAISVAASQVTGQVIADAIRTLTLGTATMSLSYTRTTMTGSSAACLLVRNATQASTTGAASVSCDSDYAYVGSDGIATHTMMNGITATNLQVPIPQNFKGANAWKIPLSPAVAASTTSADDGPIGIAINGVPIFNPCKQGGCQNGDTKVLGELDSCNGHAGRADDYHYHAAPTCLMAGQADPNYWNTHPLGWALDGFAIFGYNNADGTIATRDGICGGNTLAVSNAPSGYSYHVTDDSPYVLSCFRGTPSPDLAGQGSKYSPMRHPPVTPFAVSGMTLSTDSSDGYQVLQFTSAIAFTTTETGSDQYSNAAGTYRIRYKAVTGSTLASLLALSQNAGKTACWNFQFVADTGMTTQPAVSYCR